MGKQYTILHSTGLSRAFGALSATNLPTGFASNLNYTSTDVILNLTATISVTGSGGNQSNVANALNSFFNNGGTLPPPFVTLFGLTGSALGT